MNKRWKIGAFAALIMLCVLSVNVAAYDADSFADSNQEASSGQSNTNIATSGLFSDDRDFYLSTTDIGSLTKNLIFVNLFAPKFLGGDYQGGPIGSDRIAGFQYAPYFDAGAGFFIGANWIGFAFNYGVTEYKNESVSASKSTVLNADGSEASSTTTENAPEVSYQVQDGFKLAAIFGN
jgi:hypothetical protein